MYIFLLLPHYIHYLYTCMLGDDVEERESGDRPDPQSSKRDDTPYCRGCTPIRVEGKNNGRERADYI